MKDIRCKSCGRLLAKAKYEQLEIKCPRCKTLNKLKATEPLNQAPQSANINEVNHG